MASIFLNPLSNRQKRPCRDPTRLAYRESEDPARDREEDPSRRGLHPFTTTTDRRARARPATAERCPAAMRMSRRPFEDGNDRAVVAPPWERPPASPRAPDGRRRPWPMGMIRPHPRMPDRTAMAGFGRVPAGSSCVSRTLGGARSCDARAKRPRPCVPGEAPTPSCGDAPTTLRGGSIGPPRRVRRPRGTDAERWGCSDDPSRRLDRTAAPGRSRAVDDPFGVP